MWWQRRQARRHTLPRHDLLQVAPAVWDEVLLRTPALSGLSGAAGQMVRLWAQRGWPVIVRRPMPGDTAGSIAAALPLPPALGKQRLAFCLPAASDISVRRAILLKDAWLTAPPAWRPAMTALIRLGDEIGCEPRVYGSLLWEYVTGQSYVTPQSDLDLLWPVSSPGPAERLARGVQGIAAAAPMRLDGELLLPGAQGVNWREYLQACAQPDRTVIVKSMAGLSAVPVRHLFSTCGHAA